MIPYFPATSVAAGYQSALTWPPANLTDKAGICLMIRMESAERTGGGDAAAVERTLAGDRDAFRVLVERHSRGLFRLAYRMTGNTHDAEEIVQEAFLRAYQKLGRFESRSNFGTWLFRIAANISVDRLRKRKSEEAHRELPSQTLGGDAASPAELVADERPTPDRMALSAELQKKMRAAMEELTPAERTAFVMRHWEGCRIEEIARALRLRPGAAKNTVFRAIQKLRRSLEPFVAPRGASAVHTVTRACDAAPENNG